MKKILQRVLPTILYKTLKKIWNYYKIKKEIRAAYEYDQKRYSKYSDCYGIENESNLIGKIIREYHVIEKGLTMPETRLGFGRDLLIDLVLDCLKYIDKYGEKDEQLIFAIGVIYEYEYFHLHKGFLLDDNVVASIQKLKQEINKIDICSQIETTDEEYFGYVENPFPKFANSRSSVRNYSNEEIPLERITQAIELSRNTPSACNRQCWRTYLYNERSEINRILEIQGGSRGFGHLTNKLIVITAEIGVFTNITERNEAFIDGGMYAMNLLYSLHYQKIAACILNCSNSLEKDIKLRNICKIKDSEVFIAMVACGIPPQKFKIAASKRYNIEKTHTVF